MRNLRLKKLFKTLKQSSARLPIVSELTYPLQQIIEVKERRVDTAEKLLKKKRELLQAEQTKLDKALDEKQKVQTHYDNKLQQLRETLDEGTTSEKVEIMKNYLDVVKEKLIKEGKKVEAQQKEVTKAKQAVEEAHKDLKKKRQEVDNLETHKKEWTKEAKRELERKEEIEQDELGSIMYLNRKRKSY